MSSSCCCVPVATVATEASRLRCSPVVFRESCSCCRKAPTHQLRLDRRQAVGSLGVVRRQQQKELQQKQQLGLAIQKESFLLNFENVYLSWMRNGLLATSCAMIAYSLNDWYRLTCTRGLELGAAILEGSSLQLPLDLLLLPVSGPVSAGTRLSREWLCYRLAASRFCWAPSASCWCCLEWCRYAYPFLLICPSKLPKGLPRLPPQPRTASSPLLLAALQALPEAAAAAAAATETQGSSWKAPRGRPQLDNRRNSGAAALRRRVDGALVGCGGDRHCWEPAARNQVRAELQSHQLLSVACH